MRRRFADELVLLLFTLLVWPVYAVPRRASGVTSRNEIGVGGAVGHGSSFETSIRSEASPSEGAAVREATKKSCAALADLRLRDVASLQRLADGAQWSAVGVCVGGLVLLIVVHCARCGAPKRAAATGPLGCGGGGGVLRLLRALALLVLLVVALFSFAFVLWVRARSPRRVAVATGLTWEKREAVVHACETLLGGTVVLPSGANSSVSIFESTTTHAPDVSAFWAIPPAVLALAALLGLLHLARDALLVRFVTRSAENAEQAAKTSATLAMEDVTHLSESCVQCKQACGRADSTELPCFHHIHDVCIITHQGGSRRSAFSCPICAQ